MSKNTRYSRRVFAALALQILIVSGADKGRVQADTQTQFNLALSGSLWGNPYSAHASFDDDWSLGGANASVVGRSFRTDVGDISTGDDGLGFSQRSFRGLALGFPVGDADLTLIGGSAVLQPDVFDLLNDPFNFREKHTPLYGLRAGYHLNNSLELSATQLFTPDATERQGKDISTVALDYLPSSSQKVGLELAKGGNGYGWQLSGDTQSKKLRLSASYRRTDQDFSSAANPFISTNRNGVHLGANYKLSPRTSFSSDIYRYTDGFGGHSRSNAVGVNFAPPRLPRFSLFWRSQDDAHDARLDFAALNAKAQGPGVQIAQNVGQTAILLQYDRLDYHYPLTPASDTISNRLSLALSRPLDAKTYLSFYQVFDQRKLKQAGNNEDGKYTFISVNRRITQRGLVLELGLERQDNSFANQSGQANALRIGLDVPMRSGGAVGLHYRTNLSSSGNLGVIGNNILYVSFSHPLNIGKAPPAERLLPEPERRLLGKISGRVFEDLNNDGHWQEGEPGIPSIIVDVDHNLALETGENGNFAFRELRPRTHLVRLVMKTLPIEYAILAPSEVKMELAPTKSLMVDFPVVRTGQISGEVFQDNNRDGKQDAGEPGIADAVVRVENSDTIAFTDAQGKFTLYGLPPKEWRIRVDFESLTQGNREYQGSGQGFASVVVRPNAEVAGILLGVVEKERPVVFQNMSNTPRPTVPKTTPSTNSATPASPQLTIPAALPEVSYVPLKEFYEFLPVDFYADMLMLNATPHAPVHGIIMLPLDNRPIDTLNAALTSHAPFAPGSNDKAQISSSPVDWQGSPALVRTPVSSSERTKIPARALSTAPVPSTRQASSSMPAAPAASAHPRIIAKN